jgi:hypothetical protein
MSWLTHAGRWALAELKAAADPTSRSSAESCLQEAKRALVVCFGLVEELLERRRVIYDLVFVAGFFASAVISPLAWALVSLQEGVWRSSGCICSRRRADPATLAIEQSGSWYTLDVGVPSPPVSTAVGRRSRFAYPRQVWRRGRVS